MTRIKLLVALIAMTFSVSALAGPGYYLVATAAAAKKQEVKKVEKKKAAKPAPKKDDGKIKPLDPNRKVPTLKKKYRKED